MSAILKSFDLTPARWRALLACMGPEGARESNATSIGGRTMYWQSRAWLESNGLIRYDPPRSVNGARFYVLTPEGETLFGKVRTAAHGAGARIGSLA